MTRRVKPANQALQDRICEVLADAVPQVLTTTQIAERVGGTKTLWEECKAGRVTRWVDADGSRREHVWRCRAGDSEQGRYMHGETAKHHPGGNGQVDQDSWEIPYWASDMNAPLNRLQRDGLVEKIRLPGGHARSPLLWRWCGPDKATEVDELEALLKLDG